MADKSIEQLTPAERVYPTDLFVLQQSNMAKKLTGQTLENWLVSFADGHGGIQSIVKHSTSGLKDTYRITLADTTTFDFIVTNGRAISSVHQTNVSGLTRTYTIAFNDGTGQNFTVTDGRSITKVEKTGTNALTDTYTISYNDGTTSTFTVKNGKGISSLAKVSTVGLVDTYRIEYNDDTYDEFTVTNGAKGDKGDNTYTHIKFASQEPTASSHSMGDVPDKWIGFYWGNSATAPTDWTLYKWYQFKGDKGDTGDPAKLTSSVVEYQTSDSGTIIPSGAWQASVPVVAQGKYLWTRTTVAFNTGNPVVSYSVSRMGLDGSGSVSSVADISPDANGNVPLSAADVGALPNTGGDMVGELRMNGQPISGLNAPTANDQAANMGFVNQQVKKAAPRNLLDNTDFRNPVAQAGLNGLHGTVKYVIDRWVSDAIDSVTDNGNGLSIHGAHTYAYFYQKVENVAGKTLAFAVNGESSGTFRIGIFDSDITKLYADAYAPSGVCICIATIPSNMNTISVLIYPDVSNTGNTLDIEWAALYEGEYTEDTIPEYQPKGYAVEFAECCRYYFKLQREWIHGTMITGEGFNIRIVTPVQMRPLNLTALQPDGVAVYKDNTWLSITYNHLAHRGGGMYDLIYSTQGEFAPGASYLVQGVIALSADL